MSAQSKLKFDSPDALSDIRSEMRRRGFAAFDRYAEGVIAVTQARSVADYQSECDAAASRYLSKIGVERALPDYGSVRQEYEQRIVASDASELVESLEASIHAQKDLEAKRLAADEPLIVQTRSELKRFAERFAVREGFAISRSGMMGRRVMQKRLDRADAPLGEVFVDAGGYRGHVWSTNKMQFHLGNREGTFLDGMLLFCVEPGMIHYGSAQPSFAALKANLFEHPQAPEDVAKLIKLGVMAEITFFGLLLDRLVLTNR